LKIKGYFLGSVKLLQMYKAGSGREVYLKRLWGEKEKKPVN
jgi:hypothetical protein